MTNKHQTPLDAALAALKQIALMPYLTQAADVIDSARLALRQIGEMQPATNINGWLITPAQGEDKEITNE